MSNSVDPDETAHMSRLIWIYAVCKSLLLLPVAVKELKLVLVGRAQSCKLHCCNMKSLNETETPIFFFYMSHTKPKYAFGACAESIGTCASNQYLCFTLPELLYIVECIIIGIKHGFSCINIRQVPWEVLKTEAGGRGFQHLQRDLANVNAL